MSSQAEPAQMEEFSQFAPHSRGNLNSTKKLQVCLPFEYMQLECSWITVGIEEELGTLARFEVIAVSVRPAMRLECFECCWNAP